MDDRALIARIGELVEAEHELENAAGRHGGLDEEEQARLDELGVQLDQCWDLLRQRRARRHAGEDPDAAAVRDERVVEGYQQ